MQGNCRRVAVGHRGDAPNGHENGECGSSSEAVDEAPGEEHAEGIANLKGSDDVAVVNVVPTEDGLKGVLQRRQDVAVHVAFRGGEKQQGADDPAEVADARGTGG